jgi:hypothetical protein
LQKDVLSWHKRGSEQILLWDPAPTNRYRTTGGKWFNCTNTASWPLVTRLGHFDEIENDLALGKPYPTHIPVKRYDETVLGRWKLVTGF